MKPYRFIYKGCMLAARKDIIKCYGADFYKKFRRSSKAWLKEIVPRTPDIGNTVFSWNYAMTPAYIAWWKAACEQMTQEEANTLLWQINESVFRKIPKRLAPWCTKKYLQNFRKKAPLHQKMCEQKRVHAYDYQIKFREISDTTFEIDFYECGMLKLARDFDAEGMFPSICRVDYLMFHLGGAGFERTTTLGDGDACCGCRYIFGGSCEWSPEKGFDDRK